MIRRRKKPEGLKKKEVVITSKVEVVEPIQIIEETPVCLSRMCSNYPVKEGLCQRCRNNLNLNS